ncbi:MULTISPECIES: flagellar hook-associated protein FlgL [Paenibacillus]|jgi:flagellar hook-associated protein 3 FlgL|uniref:Flagellar biosynthesis protein FlgL n=1 Tax=Paenibacillus odorifer TaxID=189426 RepID=A0ABX3GIY8_9BACL|nr:flagellar hook-associated protein FlgL [Paenibacillus odorifer]MEC0133018.1 flagellar hook-associated protein FlgL [Paenibacillus odorifer]MEC0223453.1 flagellar hook-associated protein FlgL [Paenibacillus odorifer]OMC77561.1 flagellar biosynthesis protein FlgL [Paenibacillus odorifer]OMC92828.1 flagellar biosynthesis protein FlgL [Paenibacillus odorifer]OMD08422.1 flagellar biosynthesis protein FlgL [Paenibacillus odorifer]
MLRVTSNMMNSQLLLNLNRNARTMNDTQLQLSSGRKINKPSDDPVGITYSLRYRAELSSNEQYTKNVDSALSWLDYNDTVLGQAGDVVQKIRELSVQAATGTNPQSALDSINEEVMQLKEQLVDIANSTLNGKYIFNGEQYSTKPYDFAKGADGTYDVSKPVTTDPGQIQFIVGEGVRMPISMTGNDVFGNTGDSDNLYTIINSISAGLKAGDLGAISGQLDNIDTRMETILTARSEIGAKTNRVELMQERLSDLNVNLTDLQAKTEDADYEGLIMQSKIQENIYNASLSVGAKIISTTLVDFIR